MRRFALALLVLGVLMDGAPAPSAITVGPWPLGPSAALAADWNPLSPLPYARHGAAAAALEGKVYVLGGRWGDDLAGVTVFDPGPASWSEASPMSQTRYQLGAAALGGYVYALGGYAMDGMASLNVERLDPLSNTWSARSGLPTARAGMGVAAAGGGIVVAGGTSDEGMLGADCYRYDPVADQWSVIGTLSTPRTGVTAAALGDRVWIIGGSDGSPSAKVDVFDATSGAWSAGPDLPEPLWEATAAALDGRVWVMGGIDATRARSDRVYSAGADGVWRAESALPGARSGAFAAASSAECIMIGGGLDGTGQASAVAWSRCSTPPPPPPPPPPPAERLIVAVTLSPGSLNSASLGNWITATIETEGWPAADIVVSSLRLDGVPPASEAPITVDDSGPSGGTLTVKFPRAPFAERADGDYLLALIGERSDGTPFEGTASLSVHGGNNGLRRHGAQAHGLRVVRTAGASVVIAFSLVQPSEITMDVLDLQGRVVTRLERATLPGGEYQRAWPAAGQTVPSGIYLVRLRAAGAQAVARLALYR